MVPLHTIFPLTVHPEEKHYQLSALTLQLGDCTFAPKFIGRTKVCFFLEDVLSVVTDSHLGPLDFRNLSLVYLVGLSTIFKLTSLGRLHWLREDGSTDVNLRANFISILVEGKERSFKNNL